MFCLRLDVLAAEPRVWVRPLNCRIMATFPCVSARLSCRPYAMAPMRRAIVRSGRATNQIGRLMESHELLNRKKGSKRNQSPRRKLRASRVTLSFTLLCLFIILGTSKVNNETNQSEPKTPPLDGQREPVTFARYARILCWIQIKTNVSSH